MFCLYIRVLALNKPFLALLVDRSYFLFIRRSENQAQVTYRVSLGKPIVSIVIEWVLLVNLYRISMQEIQISMQ